MARRSRCASRRTSSRARWPARFGFCITATSANRSGEPPASDAEEVADRFSGSDLVDFLLDGGPTPGGPPSTIVEMVRTGPRCVRAGAVAWDRVLRIPRVMRPPARLRSQELRRGTPTPSVESVLQSKTSDGRERAALVGLFNPPRSSVASGRSRTFSRRARRPCGCGWRDGRPACSPGPSAAGPGDVPWQRQGQSAGRVV